MFLTDRIIKAQREASRQVQAGRVYSVELPIVGRVPVPSPRQLAVYAALGGLAAFELIDWPVALAMGVGSALVSRQLGDLERREEELVDALGAELPVETSAERTPAKKTPAKKTPARKSPAKKTPAKKAVRTAAAKRTPQRPSR